MPSTEHPATNSAELHKIERPNDLKSIQAASHLVLADTLRTLEEAFSAKGLLDREPQDIFQPLWYLVETERNVFLWKRGCSIIQQDDFEFWVDIPALIQKRRRQLENADAHNPFVNSLWGIGTDTVESASRELNYLEEFLSLLADIQEHLCALCEATSQVQSTLNGPPARERVVLPSRPR